MSASALLGFALASLLIELTPGPNMAWLATVALTRGRKAALAAVAGVGLGLAALGALAAFGVTALLQDFPALWQVLRVAGFLYLLWLAWDAWAAPAASADGADFASFTRGFVSNLLNPKAALFYVVFLPRFMPQENPAGLSMALALVAVYVAVATAVHLSIALLASTARPLIAGARDQRRVRLAFALALAATAIWFAISTR